MMAVEAFAPAKINLTLHVTGQRNDGYHLLDSLVVFADIGDTVTVAPADQLRLMVDGPMADGVPTDGGNLVIKASRQLSLDNNAAITLTKRLPASSGIGGGSSDAAAALRALSELWNLPLPDRHTVLSLGADVPVCMEARTVRMSGIGEDLSAVPTIPAMDVLLVNPGVSVPTPSVFRALKNRDNPPMPAELPHWNGAVEFCRWLKRQRNDLQDPAIALEPVIADVLSTLEESGCLHAAMSGSGATCFALFHEGEEAVEAACRSIADEHPDWWVACGRLI